MIAIEPASKRTLVLGRLPLLRLLGAVATALMRKHRGVVAIEPAAKRTLVLKHLTGLAQAWLRRL
jgi:hypothetical protein